MAVNTTYGADFAIGPALTPSTTPDETSAAAAIADFAAFTYLSVNEVTDMGSIGDTSTDVTHLPIKAGRTKHYKGSRNMPEQTIACAYDPFDPGQIAMRAAADSQADFPVRIQLDDAPEGGTPSIFYYYAKVSAAPITFGGTDTITAQNFTVLPNSGLYVVEAAEDPTP